MDDFFILDTQNPVTQETGKKLGNRSSCGTVERKRLGDISNLHQQTEPSSQDEKLLAFPTAKEYIDNLYKENMTLVRLLAERHKIIELSSIEMQKLRVNLQKVQQQNFQLAQANSQMLAELNSGKDRLKALQHELGCKDAVIKAKQIGFPDKAKARGCKTTGNEVRAFRREEGRAEATVDDSKPCSTNRRRHSMNIAMVTSTIEQMQLTEEHADNKRHCLRRQSTTFKREPKPKQESECNEDSFETNDAAFPTTVAHEESPKSLFATIKSEASEAETDSGYESYNESRRSSVLGRPSRRAAGKVQSYKETPLNVKMRRPA